jgi:hypothetical protein
VPFRAVLRWDEDFSDTSKYVPEQDGWHDLPLYFRWFWDIARGQRRYYLQDKGLK